MPDQLSPKAIGTLVFFAGGFAALWFCWPFWVDGFRFELLNALANNPPVFWGFVVASLYAIAFIVGMFSFLWNHRLALGTRTSALTKQANQSRAAQNVRRWMATVPKASSPTAIREVEKTPDAR